jgi:hypothetical protein
MERQRIQVPAGSPAAARPQGAVRCSTGGHGLEVLLLEQAGWLADSDRAVGNGSLMAVR